jgi:hypothetical protein
LTVEEAEIPPYDCTYMNTSLRTKVDVMVNVPVAVVLLMVTTPELRPVDVSRITGPATVDTTVALKVVIPVTDAPPVFATIDTMQVTESSVVGVRLEQDKLNLGLSIVHCGTATKFAVLSPKS